MLLVRFEFPGGAVRWAAPGGGIEAGETAHSALHRELTEELGMVDPPIGAEIWTRTHVIPFVNARWDGQAERYFLVETRHFEPRPTVTREELAAEFVTAMRWWTQQDLAAADVTFAPTRLPELIEALLTEGPPPAPIDAGV